MPPPPGWVGRVRIAAIVLVLLLACLAAARIALSIPPGSVPNNAPGASTAFAGEGDVVRQDAAPVAAPAQAREVRPPAPYLVPPPPER